MREGGRATQPSLATGLLANSAGEEGGRGEGKGIARNASYWIMHAGLQMDDEGSGRAVSDSHIAIEESRNRKGGGGGGGGGELLASG